MKHEHIYSSSEENAGDISILLFLMLAAAGLLYYLQTDGKDETREYAQTIVVRNIDTTQNNNGKLTDSREEKGAMAELVNTNIQPEANQQCVFRLAKFSKNALYQIDPGDGKLIKFVDGEVAHTYREAARFTAILYVTYNGKTVKLQKKKINVAPPLRDVSYHGIEF